MSQITPQEQAGYKLQAFAPPDEFMQFIRALVEANVFLNDGPTSGILGFLEKPWHWADEFVAWDAAGRPLDASERGWDLFQEAVEV